MATTTRRAPRRCGSRRRSRWRSRRRGVGEATPRRPEAPWGAWQLFGCCTLQDHASPSPSPLRLAPIAASPVPKAPLLVGVEDAAAEMPVGGGLLALLQRPLNALLALLVALLLAVLSAAGPTAVKGRAGSV
mmetsp:Transcript_48462/g.156535  ORF Transcript_48462/g.156535 Transcript_48462/m.156535 type:complete len:132 (+) Transcript_48462:2764-3159(+)